MKKSITARGKELLAFAEEQKRAGLNWVQANNALYGPGGKFMQLFPSRAERTAFANSPEDKLLTSLLASLPTPPPKELTREASGKLVVRMPKSIHQALIAEAKDEGVSLNQLILSKLSMQLKAVS